MKIMKFSELRNQLKERVLSDRTIYEVPDNQELYVNQSLVTLIEIFEDDPFTVHMTMQFEDYGDFVTEDGESFDLDDEIQVSLHEVKVII